MPIKRVKVISHSFSGASLPGNLTGKPKGDPDSLQVHREWMRRAEEKGALDVPLDPQQFYEKIGLLPHPKTMKPVTRLAPYQIEVSRAIQDYRRVVLIKSQKIGISTSILMTDFQLAILPSTDYRSCRGYEILVVAQSLDAARQHIDTLRRMISNSDVYRDYLITEPMTEVGLNRDEVSKVERLYIYNPDNPRRPTRIIGRGPKERTLWSWKNVKHVHMSDIAVVNEDYTGAVHTVLTRLANTDGSMVIETPPSPQGPTGKIYDIWQKAHDKTDLENPEGQFHPIQLDYRAAVAANVISEDMIKEYKQQFGSEFARYFEAQWIAGGGNVFDPKDIERAELLGKKVDYHNFVGDAGKVMGIDPGFGSSKFGIVVSQLNNGMAEVIYAREFQNSTPSLMIEHAAQLAQRYYVNTIFIDGANAGWVRDLKMFLDDNPESWKEIEKAQTKYAAGNFRSYLTRIADFMRAIPIGFGPHGKEMLAHAQAMLSAGRVAIHPDFSGLLAQMRSATEINRDLNKTSKTPLDLIDALRLNLLYYELPPAKANDE